MGGQGAQPDDAGEDLLASGELGFGISLGGMWSDAGCERRHSAVVLYQMGEHKAAIALMCQDRHVAEAMQAAGEPCPGAAPATRGAELRRPIVTSLLERHHPRAEHGADLRASARGRPAAVGPREGQGECESFIHESSG